MMKTLLILTLLVSVRSQIHCPQQSWAQYKNVWEGSWSFRLPPSGNNEPVRFRLGRITSYTCTGNNLQFVTTRYATVGFRQNVNSDNYQIFYTNLNINDCTQQCDSISITVTLEFSRRLFNNPGQEVWSPAAPFDSFVFVKKNCDKLYWTSWATTSNCRTSRQIVWVRNCTDCDGDYVDPQYCNGRFSSQTQCQPVWNEWSEAGDCVATRCNSTGERLRTRKCLYGDGSEASNVQLCSNASSNMTETCTVNITSNDCAFSPNKSSMDSNLGLYIGVGVAAALVVILFVVVAVVLYRRGMRCYSKNKRTDSDLSPYATVNPTTEEEPPVYYTVTTPDEVEATYSSLQKPSGSSKQNVYDIVTNEVASETEYSKLSLR